MRVAMVGTGYVGLISGACFADFGHDVVCIDSDVNRIHSLERGEMPIYEPGLVDLVASNVKAGRLAFSTRLPEHVRQADVVFIAVGTPSRRGDGHADLSFVFDATQQIASAVVGFKVIVTKSTVPVGTGDAIEQILQESRSGNESVVVSNPEFLREGAAIHDFKHPDRIVIGTCNPRAREVMAALYRPLFLNAAPVLYTDRRTAELIKYAANSFLATKVTFINEIADLCEKVGANVQEVAKGIGLDNRIGAKFLHPGPGYGGSCFPKDTLALMKTARDYGEPLRVLEAVVQVNASRQGKMADKILGALGGDVAGKTLAILGLTFKPNTDDMREAPSIGLIKALQERGAAVRAYDPVGMKQAAAVLQDVTFTENAYEATKGCSGAIIVTEWEEFRALDLSKMREQMREPILVDLRNIYSPQEARLHGFSYTGLGRGDVTLISSNALQSARTGAKNQ